MLGNNLAACASVDFHSKEGVLFLPYSYLSNILFVLNIPGSMYCV